MGRLIAEGAKDLRVRRTAIDVLIQHGVRPKDYPGEIQALFAWAQRHIRYTRDTVRVEIPHSARCMLELRAAVVVLTLPPAQGALAANRSLGRFQRRVMSSHSRRLMGILDQPAGTSSLCWGCQSAGFLLAGNEWGLAAKRQSKRSAGAPE